MDPIKEAMIRHEDENGPPEEAEIESLRAERDALKKFRDQFNEVFDDSYKAAEAIVRHHTNTPAVFGVQPDHRFKENASPLAVVADVAQAIAAARCMHDQE